VSSGLAVAPLPVVFCCSGFMFTWVGSFSVFGFSVFTGAVGFSGGFSGFSGCPSLSDLVW
jgi:hypothetical protein